MQTSNIKKIAQLYQPDGNRIKLAMKRQAEYWRGQKPDKPPIILQGELTAEQQKIPEYNLDDAFNHPDFMLCNELRQACKNANSGSDIVPSIRVNMGTGICLACLGLEQYIFPDKMPWLKEHLNKEQISKLEPDDIKIQGSFARAIEYIHRFREIMKDRLPIYCLDTQGPLDLAHLMLGNDLFLAFYEDPPFVHHLMELCVEIGKKCHLWVKEAAGEPVDTIWMGLWGIYAENMGIRICEDTTALIGEELILEFAIPYTQKLAQQFGGCFVHYCGRKDVLTEAVLKLPEVKGINFGHIPGHEEDHDFEADMQHCLEHKKVYFGDWPKYAGEDSRSYLHRLNRWAQKRCLIPIANAALEGNSGFSSTSQVLKFWQSL